MRKLAVLLSSSLVSAALLTGCGFSASDPAAMDTSSAGTLAIQGRVIGGQQAVYQSTIQLYTAGKTGNGSPATPMLTTLVQTDTNGNFGITGDYHCTNSTDQVYIVAYGGQAIRGYNNTALVMMDALGNCGNLTSSTYITINEVTTVAAAWALAPFMQASYVGAAPASQPYPSYGNLGATSTNSAGLANAFLDAQLIASSGTGLPASLASNLTVQPGKVLALADVIATCVNSNGTTSPTCSLLFSTATPANGTQPSDTLSAALNIVKYPGQNPGGVFNLINAQSPFPTTLTTAPYDWTLTLTVTGGGISSPTAIDIDKAGNVWVGDYYGALSEVSPQGTPLSGSGFGNGDLHEVYGMTIDSLDNIWVANEESSPNAKGSLSKFLGTSSGSPGTLVTNNGASNFYDSSLDFPISLSADSNSSAGDFFIANYYNYSATAYNDAGTPIGAGYGSSYAAFPVAVAADNTGGVWIANNGSDTVTHVDASGNLMSNLNCCDGANGIATDAAGNAWVANYYGNSFSEVSNGYGSAASVLINGKALVGSTYFSYPAGIAVDGAQNVWIANYRGESISEVSGYLSTTPGTVLSPVAGYGYSGPPPTVPLLQLPYGVVPDRSGNLWVSDLGNNNLIMFFGLAAPTITPTRSAPTAP